MKKIPDSLFPYSSIRDVQSELIQTIEKVLGEEKDLVVHAPTGLGKTAAALAPCIRYAMENDKVVFFLTSRHTQHQIAIDTVQDIKKKHGINVITSDVIGKKWMCAQPAVEQLYSGEFAEFCRNLRENDKCEFYTNTKKGTQVQMAAKKVLGDMIRTSPKHTEQLIEEAKEKRLCPYEMAMLLASKAHVVIADYFYIFNESIRNSMLKRMDKDLKDAIVIVDEGHNLPGRIRDLATQRLTSMMLKRGITEAKKLSYHEAVEKLARLQDILLHLSRELRPGQEVLVPKKELVKRAEEISDYEELVSDLELVAETARETRKQSYVGSIASFLAGWPGRDEGFARILSMQESKGNALITLSYRCLDPSVISRDVLEQAQSTILMSGTLTPTSMYRDLLGFEDAEEATFSSPFDNDNRLNLVVPYTSTRYNTRSQEQYKRIASVCAGIVNAVPGNSLLFFPSYKLRDEIREPFSTLSEKTVIMEDKGLTKKDKADMLMRFKSYSKTGAAMLAVASGSFGEGIDLPGDLLKAVIVVGLPLQHPDLETKSLIQYFDSKFGKGWDYGYVFPAFNRVLQSAGRCIRSETDRGVIVFLDERYIYPNYKRCFPEDWDMAVSRDFVGEVKEFFHRS